MVRRLPYRAPLDTLVILLLCLQWSANNVVALGHRVSYVLTTETSSKFEIPLVTVDRIFEIWIRSIII